MFAQPPWSSGSLALYGPPAIVIRHQRGQLRGVSGAVLQLGSAVNVGLTNSISGRLVITRPLPPARTLPYWIVLSVGIVRAGRLQCGWGGAAPPPL